MCVCACVHAHVSASVLHGICVYESVRACVHAHVFVCVCCVCVNVLFGMKHNAGHKLRSVHMCVYVCTCAFVCMYFLLDPLF